MAEYWSTAKGEVAEFMNRIPKVVFSKTLEKAEWNNTRLVSGDAVAEIMRMKREAGKVLFIFGSAQLVSALLSKGLVDEYRIGLIPVLLGKGTPLFKPDTARQNLKLMDSMPLKSGCAILRYAFAGDAKRVPSGESAKSPT